MAFKSGNEWTGNKSGRPRKPEIELFRAALEKVEQEQGTTLLEHAVKRAFTSEAVLVAVLKKILPDLTHDKGVSEAVRTFLIRANDRNAEPTSNGH